MILSDKDDAMQVFIINYLAVIRALLFIIRLKLIGNLSSFNISEE
jgi:hypothetical protein